MARPTGVLSASDGWSPWVKALNMGLDNFGSDEALLIEIQTLAPAALVSHIELEWPAGDHLPKCIVRQLNREGGLLAFGDGAVTITTGNTPAPPVSEEPFPASQAVSVLDRIRSDGGVAIRYLIAFEEPRAWARDGAKMAISLESDAAFRYRLTGTYESSCVTALQHLDGGNVVQTPAYVEAQNVGKSFAISQEGYVWAGVEGDISYDATLRNGSKAEPLGPARFWRLDPGEWEFQIHSLRARQASVLLFVLDLPAEVVDAIQPVVNAESGTASDAYPHRAANRVRESGIGALSGDSKRTSSPSHLWR